LAALDLIDLELGVLAQLAHGGGEPGIDGVRQLVTGAIDDADVREIG